MLIKTFSNFQVEPISEFWHKTGSTLLCHLNIENDVPDLKSHQAALDYLSNLTPGSFLYNQTIQKLRRNKRSTADSHTHKKINSRKDHDSSANPHELIEFGHHAAPNKTVHTTAHHNSNSNHTQLTAAMLRKINTEKYWKKLKNYTKYKHKIIINSHNQTPMKVSTLILNTNGRDDCGQLSLFCLLAICVYITFTICLYNFLFLSESAVFTVSVMSAALPVSGIFWSMFELTTMNNMGKLMLML